MKVKDTGLQRDLTRSPAGGDRKSELATPGRAWHAGLAREKKREESTDMVPRKTYHTSHWILVFTVLAVLPNSAWADLSNPSFETAGISTVFNAWTNSGTVTSQGNNWVGGKTGSTNHTWSPDEGSKFALLTVSHAVSDSKLSQSFEVPDGYEGPLSFHYFYDVKGPGTITGAAAGIVSGDQVVGLLPVFTFSGPSWTDGSWAQASTTYS